AGDAPPLPSGAGDVDGELVVHEEEPSAGVIDVRVERREARGLAAHGRVAHVNVVDRQADATAGTGRSRLRGRSRNEGLSDPEVLDRVGVECDVRAGDRDPWNVDDDVAAADERSKE